MNTVLINVSSDVTAMEFEDSTMQLNGQMMSERPMAVPHLATDAERSLNFTTSPGDEFDFTFVKKPKSVRDPLSHRIIEKRRRDRMNNCLADLSRLIPSNYLKQGQGRIEKTEIIEMAIRHIKNLTNVINKQGALKSSLPDRYLGFKECQDEVMRYLVEVEGWDAHDQLCSRMMNHLEHAGEKFRIMNDESLSQDAKEEQYRHVEEDISISGVIEGAGTEPPTFTVNPDTMPQFPQKTLQSPAQTGQQSVTAAVPETAACDQLPKPFPDFESLACAQQIAQEHLKRDKHLWTLLTTKFNSKYGVDDSGMSSGQGSTGESKFSLPSHNSDGNKGSPEPASSLIHASSQTSMDTSVDTNMDKADSSVYKFKHNITKRFSEETTPKILNPNYMYSSSSSSRDGHKRMEKMKRKFRHVRSHSPSSTVSSQYPNSDSSNNNSSSNGETSVRTEDIKSTSLLPGFVLHPVGTHYIPMSIHPSSVGPDYFTKITRQKHDVFHPVSIPVSFGGPLLCLKRVNIVEQETVESRNSSDGSNSGSTSACMSSENSPISEQEVSKNT